MATISRLATSLNHHDEVPNKELAIDIVAQSDAQAITELVNNLTNKNKGIQGDCIKVLYEIGARKPSLIREYTGHFISLLESTNNRLQWGAMIALNTLTKENPDAIYTALPTLTRVAEKGSVITKDHYVRILVKLYSVKRYSSAAFTLLNQILLNCAINQLPMYAEIAIPVIDEEHRADVTRTLALRLEDVEKDAQRRRLEKVIKKLGGK